MRRLFFGFSIAAPWDISYPEGRLIAQSSRHITLAFLGNIDFSPLEEKLSEIPLPSFPIGPVGKTDQVLFLPEKKPRVVAHHVSWISDGEKIERYHQQLLDWLETLGFKVARRPFLPHTTLARSPFDPTKWEEAFHPLPLFISGITLYESLGNLTYTPIWENKLILPFEEFEHTADIAFHVRGMTENELYLHAALALSFTFPPILSFLENIEMPDHNAVVRALNKMIATCDLEMGCPFKAVSYHGELKKDTNQLLHWEMIVDV